MKTMYPNVPVNRVNPMAPLPTYAHEGDAGMDLRTMETVTIGPHETVLVGSGIAMAIPEGFEGECRPRSGMASKHGITIANTPGTIDTNLMAIADWQHDHASEYADGYDGHGIGLDNDEIEELSDLITTAQLHLSKAIAATVGAEPDDGECYLMYNGKRYPAVLDFGFLGLMPITIDVGGFRYLVEVPNEE